MKGKFKRGKGRRGEISETTRDVVVGTGESPRKERGNDQNVNPGRKNKHQKVFIGLPTPEPISKSARKKNKKKRRGK